MEVSVVVTQQGLGAHLSILIVPAVVDAPTSIATEAQVVLVASARSSSISEKKKGHRTSKGGIRQGGAPPYKLVNILTP